MSKYPSFYRRYKRHHVDPITASKYRKGNKGTKLKSLQVIKMFKKIKFIGFYDKLEHVILVFKKTITIQHWKM
jgi:hypothetical protein